MNLYARVGLNLVFTVNMEVPAPWEVPMKWQLDIDQMAALDLSLHLGMHYPFLSN